MQANDRSGQTLPFPKRLITGLTLAHNAGFFLVVFGIVPAVLCAAEAPKVQTPWRSIWKISAATVAASNAADIFSSVGPHRGYEINPLMTDSHGRYNIS